MDACPAGPGSKEPTASRRVADRVGTLRRQVMSLLREVGPRGLTADEIAERLGESVLSIRPRVTELCKDGRIERTDERRLNDSGSKAHVLRRAAL